jgi:hypothetical protein
MLAIDLRGPATTRFQPRRLMIAPAADGCKSLLDRIGNPFENLLEAAV